jgi:hypothetical protein
MRKIFGFENTDYAYLGDEIVWAGTNPMTSHPRVVGTRVTPLSLRDISPTSQGQTKTGARICLNEIAATDTHGLLLWLTDRDLPFPLNHAKPRFDAVRTALQANDIQAFEEAALRVLGLGNGLTPSGDDFLGGIFFALAHKSHPKWLLGLPALQGNLRMACEQSTNPISAALLSDNMAGTSYGVLHDMLNALESNDVKKIKNAREALLHLGSSSGADLLAGLLLALTMI